MLAVINTINCKQSLVSKLYGNKKYAQITGNKDECKEMEKPLPYNPKINRDTMDNNVLQQMEAEHAEQQIYLYARCGSLLGIGDRIREALDKKVLQKTPQASLRLQKCPGSSVF